MSIFNPTDDQKKEAIRLHVSEEFNTFYICYKRLNENMQEPDLRIHLESFLLHARNLFDFLTTSTRDRDKKAEKFNDKDVIAADFINQKIQVNFPENIKTRINRQLQHISYSRLLNDQVDLYKERGVIFKLIKEGIEEYNKKASKDYQLNCTD